MVRSSSAISLYGVGMSSMPTTYGGKTTGFVSALGGSIAKCNECLPAVPFATSMTGFVSFLETLRASIDSYFPALNVNAPLITDVGFSGTMNIRMFALLMWGNEYRETYGMFDETSMVHVNLLKDVYIRIGYDWTIDTWLRDWQPTDIPPTDIPV